MELIHMALDTALEAHEELLGKSLDRLTTVEMPLPGMSWGVASELFDAAIEIQNCTSLSMASARALRNACTPGEQNVLLITGAGCLPWMPHGETDGPTGVAILGRTLADLFGVRPVFVSEAHFALPIQAAVTAAGIPLVSQAELAYRSGAGAIRLLSADSDGEHEASAILDEIQPIALITVERLAPNKAGRIHTSQGADVTSYHSRTSYELVRLCMSRDILTLGFGDAGNEIGAAVIASAIRELVPYAESCQCECRSGIISDIPTDVYVSSAVSDWGAYATAAALCCLLKRPEVFGTANRLAEIVKACTLAGAYDSVSLRPEPNVDGVSLDAHVAMYRVMEAMLDSSLTPRSRPF